MKAVGYADCSECGMAVLRAYPRRGHKPGDELCVWAHVPAGCQTGWGRQPKCAGSYKPGQNSRLFTELGAVNA